MLNNSGVCGHSLISDFNGNVISSVYPLSMMLFCGLRWAFFYHIKEKSIHSYLINFNRSQTLSKKTGGRVPSGWVESIIVKVKNVPEDKKS